MATGTSTATMATQTWNDGAHIVFKDFKDTKYFFEFPRAILILLFGS